MQPTALIACSHALQVTQNGLVRTLPGFRHFPDTKADVTGKKIQVRSWGVQSRCWHVSVLPALCRVLLA